MNLMTKPLSSASVVHLIWTVILDFQRVTGD